MLLDLLTLPAAVVRFRVISSAVRADLYDLVLIDVADEIAFEAAKLLESDLHVEICVVRVETLSHLTLPGLR